MQMMKVNEIVLERAMPNSSSNSIGSRFPTMSCRFVVLVMCWECIVIHMFQRGTIKVNVNQNISRICNTCI